MGLRAVILGCGSSGGVPRVGGDWGFCDPSNPRNKRSRSSLYVEYWDGEDMPAPENRTAIVIDTSPDLREQFLAADIKRLDAVVFTHEHADQSHGPLPIGCGPKFPLTWTRTLKTMFTHGLTIALKCPKAGFILPS